MASSNGKLVFPVKFDLQSAVNEATRDGDKALTAIEKFMRGRAIRPRIEFDTSAFKAFENGMNNTLEGIQSRMSKLQEYWNKQIANNLKFDKDGKLSENVVQLVHSISMLADGTTKINYEKLSPKQIYKEFVELTAAAKTCGVTLSEYARKQEQAIAAQEREIQRTKELASLLTNESHARDILNQKLKFYTSQMNSSEQGSSKWKFNSEMVRQLREEIDKLDIAQKKATANSVNEDEKARQASLKRAAAALNLSQTYDALSAKMRALQSIRNESDKGSKSWQYATEEIIKTNHALTTLTAVQKASTQTLYRETEAVRTMVRELRAYGETLGQMQTRLSAYQSLLNNTKVGDNAFAELSLQIRRANEELARGKQLAADYQNKAFMGLGDAKTKEKVAEVTQLRDKIRELDKEMNSLHQRGLGTDKNGNLTAEMVNKLNQRIALEKELNNILTTGADMAKKKLEEEIAARQKAIDAANKEEERLARLREIFSMSLKSIEGLNARLGEYNSRLQKCDVGTKAFEATALLIARLSGELQRATQYAQDFAQRAFQGLRTDDTYKRVQELQKWRGELQRIDEEYNRLRNIQLQGNGGAGIETQLTALIDKRMGVVEKINNTLRTAEQAQLEREKEITAEKEKQRKLAEEEEKLRKQRIERNNLLKSQSKDVDTLTRKIQYYQELLNRLDPNIKPQSVIVVSKEIAKLTQELNNTQEELNKIGRRAEELRALREAMKASERTVEGLNKKLQVFQQLLSKIEAVDSQGKINPKWSRTAEQVRRLSEELERANQRLQDFQSKAFRGLSANFTAQQTEAVTNLRNQIDAIDKKFNQLYQNGRATNADGTFTTRVNDMLKERARLQSEISKMMMTAADAQIQREKEINRVIEQRKAKEKEAKAAHQQELAALAKKREANDRIRKILAAEENTIKSITAKLQVQQNRLNATDVSSKKFERIAKEVERLTKLLDEARRKMADMTGQSTSGTSRQAANARKVNEEYTKQLGYIDRLIRRMAVYGSVGMIGNFLTKVREITAQFELQRISLGAILQDQNKANQLFSEIKSFALKSPVSILDLTKYTKQLAAYKIGYDELFETTKKLTDVSVGLGVSMDRVVLAYGQVRATGHLRASEIRQFTEMGVPIVEELAAKLSKMNGEMVTAAQVMDMVSKRAISFEMVKEVFDDMTSAGGIFYNMQEKQGNTLYGLWAKLGDAASVMYSEIGNVGWINSLMKGFIGTSTSLMKNWRAVGLELAVLTAGFGAYKLIQSLTTVSTIAASRATRDYAVAHRQLEAAQKSNIWGGQAAAKYAMKAAAANRAAALSTNLWTAAKLKLIAVTNQLKAAFLGNWITIAITAVFAIGAAIYSAHEKANRLKNTLADLKAETSTLQGQSVRNFEYLADAAVKAADGSKKQKDALDELYRTYKDMLPEEALKIENLKAMKGNYDALTQAIRENIAAQQESKALEEVKNEYSPKIIKAQKKADEALKDAGFGDVEIQRFFRNIERHYKELSDRVRRGENIDIMGTIFDMSGIDRDKLSDRQLMEVAEAYTHIVNAQEAWLRKEEAVRQSYRESTADLGVYNKSMQIYDKWVEENLNSGETMLQQRQNANMQILGMESMIRQEMQKAGLVYREEWANLIQSVDPNDLNNISTLNMEAIIAAIDPVKYPDLWKYIDAYRKIYNGLVPPDPTVQQIRAKFFAIAQSVGAPIDKMKQHLWDGSASVDEHLKYLNDQIAQYEAKLQKMQTTVANSGLFGTIASVFLKGSIEDTTKIIEALKQQAEFVKTYTTTKPAPSKDGGSRKSDTRLQELQEINQTLEKINKKYGDLQRKEGRTKALKDIKKQFEDTLDYTNRLGKKFGLHFDYPTEFKSLQEYRNEILKAMKTLKNLKGGEKAILEFQTMIDEADSEHLQKQIEKQLKEIADNISRAKVADEFYKKILSATGDYEIAGEIAERIFGQDGRKLQSILAEQVKNLTNGLELPKGIISEDNIINYEALREWAEANKDELGDMYKELVKISEDGQKNLAKSYEGYLKDLEKAKTYADKRVELARTTAEKIREIEREVKAGNYTESEGETLKRGYLERESREESKLEWDAFKNMPIYTQMFEDLEHASTSTLTMMKNHLTGLKGMWGSALDPTQIKEIQGRIEEIEEQLETRNPWKTLKISWENYRNALESYDLNKAVENVGKASEGYYVSLKDYGEGSAQSKMAKRELGVQRKILEISRLLTNETGKRLKGTKALDKANQLAYKNQLVAQQELNNALADEQDAITKYGEDSEQYKAAHAVVEEKREELKIAEKVSEITQRNSNTATKWKDSMAAAVGEITKYMSMASDAARSIADLTEAFGGSEEDVQFWNDIADGLGNITAGFEDLMNNIMSLNIAGIISSAITAIPKMIIGFMDIFSAGKIRKANKEIKRQQELLEQLEYTYGRLEKAADKLFGADYLQNHNQRLRALEAKRQAYLKQARAEQSKGKKEDKAKTKEYLDNARDVADEIAELQDDLVSQITGTDVASAARDFANAWLDAYISFESTTGAIKEKFNDMIKNMVVNMIMARVVEKALQPIFDEIDRLDADRNLSAADIGVIFSMVPQSMEDINNGLGVALQSLEAAGIDIRSLGANADSVSGIAKGIAGATSEEINNVAAIGNTLMYYVSTLPRIDEKISRIVSIMERGGGSIGSASATGWTDWQQQAMDNYNAIQRNTADAVVECRRAANAAEETVRKLGKIITDKGSVSGVNVFMKG